MMIEPFDQRRVRRIRTGLGVVRVGHLICLQTEFFLKYLKKASSSQHRLAQNTTFCTCMLR